MVTGTVTTAPAAALAGGATVAVTSAPDAPVTTVVWALAALLAVLVSPDVVVAMLAFTATTPWEGAV